MVPRLTPVTVSLRSVMAELIRARHAKVRFRPCEQCRRFYAQSLRDTGKRHHCRAVLDPFDPAKVTQRKLGFAGKFLLAHPPSQSQPPDVSCDNFIPIHCTRNQESHCND